MPSQPKIDPAKLRSQTSRRVNNSFPVLAPLVWHAGHADGEASWFGMPGMPGKKLACPARLILYSLQHHILRITYNRQIYLRELEVTGFMPGNKCRL